MKAATETVVKVPAKDKVEVVQRENGKKVKVTTIYTVDEKTGNIIQTEREEEISSEDLTSKSDEKAPTVEELKPFEGGVNPAESVVTEELKPFEGGVNPAESVVTEELKPFEGGVNSEIASVKEELPELKIALLRDEEGNVLDVLANSEKPKELKGYKYTGKEEVDGEGNKIYIYEKDKSGVITSKSDEEAPTVEELKPFEGGVSPAESVMTEELKPFEGGINTEIASVKEELPELKIALLRDEEGNVLDVLANSEKPKELKGYKYTGKEEVDGEGNKIYIYQKVELENFDNKKQETVDINQSQNTESQNGTAASKKAQVQKLPNTGKTPVESGVLGGMLLVATTMLSKRKLKK